MKNAQLAVIVLLTKAVDWDQYFKQHLFTFFFFFNDVAQLLV